MKHISIITGLLLILPFKAILGQEDSLGSFSLQQAQQYGLEYNTRVKNSRLDRKQAKKDVNATLASGFPQINGQANFQKNFDIRTNIISFQFPQSPEPTNVEVKFGTNYTLDAQVTASQLVFDGTYFVGIKASRTYTDLTQKQLQQQETDTRANIAKAYYLAVFAEKNSKILKKNLQQIKNSLAETRKMYQNGFVEKLDVDRLQLSLTQVKNQLRTTQRQVAIAYKLLKFQMGYPIRDSLQLSQDLSSFLKRAPVTRESISRFKPSKRIDYQLLQVRENLSRLNIKKYQAGYWPKLSLFATHLQSGQRDEFNFLDENKEWYPATYGGFSLNVPIFDGFRKRAQIQKARLELEKVQNQKENLKQSIRLEARRAWKEYNDAREKIKSQEENLDLAQNIYRQTRTKYNEGVGSSLEVITAQQDLFKARATYLNAIYRLLVAKTDLKKALANY